MELSKADYDAFWKARKTLQAIPRAAHGETAAEYQARQDAERAEWLRQRDAGRLKANEKARRTPTSPTPSVVKDLSEPDQERAMRWALEKIDSLEGKQREIGHVLKWARMVLRGKRLAVVEETARCR